MKSFVDSRVIFLDVITDLIPEWKTIASLPTPQGAEGLKTLAEMKKLREKNSVSLSAAALNTLGLVSNTIFNKLDTSKKKEELEENVKKQLEPLSQVEWHRDAEIWQGNLIQMGVDKKTGEPKLLIKTQTSSIKEAHLKLLEVLNLT